MPRVLFVSPGYPSEMPHFVRGLAEVGAEVCEGDQLLRCDGQFYRVLAPCAGKCIEGKAEIAHTGDTISADETWTCTDGPHLVEGIVKDLGFILMTKGNANKKLSEFLSMMRA